MTKEFRVVRGEHCLGTWTELNSAKRLFDELKKGLSKGEILEIEEVKDNYLETIISAVGDD